MAKLVYVTLIFSQMKVCFPQCCQIETNNRSFALVLSDKFVVLLGLGSSYCCMFFAGNATSHTIHITVCLTKYI